MRNWKSYIEKTKSKTPSGLMIKALSYVQNFDHALDLGAGALVDTRYLQERGFKEIDVVDSEPSVAEIAPEGVNVHILSYEQFAFPRASYDFVNAQYALPFAGQHMQEVMARIRDALKEGGVFSGTFFGPHDDWAADAEVAVIDAEWVRSFFNPDEWGVHKSEEEEADRPTAEGTNKHWHVFSVIASRVK